MASEALRPPVPSLSVTPAVALIDAPRRIAAHGLDAGETVTLQGRTVRGAGALWLSGARFVADAKGTVDLARDAPCKESVDGQVRSSYEGVSPMGLLWSQVPEASADPRAIFAATTADDLHTTIELRRGDGSLLRADLVQQLATAGVTRRQIREAGLVGTLFLPAPRADGKPPAAILVLNGSGGGINEPRAALYASHGYAALALAYFKAPGLSDTISNTPLELFEHALSWMHQHLQPRHGFIAVSGQSRGGELALLLGSMFWQQISAVIAYVPGAVVHSAQNACDPALGPDSRNGPAWIYRGQALPHLWQDNRTASWDAWDHGTEPRRHANALLTALQDEAAVDRARIAVEHINGPVLLLTASDDGSWPSSLYGRMVSERLAAHRHPHAVEHLDYPGAGHSILFPYLPTTQSVYRHPVSGRLSTTGGASAANAAADEDSWAAVLHFLAAALQKLEAQGSIR